MYKFFFQHFSFLNESKLHVYKVVFVCVAKSELRGCVRVEVLPSLISLMLFVFFVFCGRKATLQQELWQSQSLEAV